MIRVLITGGNGQVGRSIAELATDERFRSLDITVADRSTVDITDRAGLDAAFDRLQPDVVINAAAYTSVDVAESDEAAATAVNTGGVASLANLCAANDARLLHLSTDYVFDGTKDGWYVESDPIAPLGVYGRTKAAGEAAAQACPAHLILRTSWVYSAHGDNFVRTMLRIGAEHPELRVVDDQVGCPTSAHDIAEALLHLSSLDANGTYHLAGADQASWHEFAVAIFAAADLTTTANPISTAGFPTPAPRPANSRLDSSALADATGVRLPSWRDSLSGVVSAILDTDQLRTSS
ncbi:MAG: dTDP-4-dehydrorhamnose reductase [Acidimicrobiaceae bacterium]|nr:dTDP-4-dehydrorhamnose reductase [Acidimicrobiaceae bacterium]